MMQLAQCPVSKTRKYGMRCWDAREAMQALARWTGSWASVVQLMARTNPSLAEALSPWSAPHDAAELLEGFRLSINALADEQHTGFPIRCAC